MPTVRTLSRLLLRAATALIALWLAACAAPEPVAPSDRRAAAEAHQRWLEGLSQWRASGRVAVEVPGDGWSATLLWLQRKRDYRIQLSGPFGQGAVRIDGDSSGVTLRTADGRVARAPGAEELMAQELGAQVPVTVLRYWLTGRPAPRHPVTHRLLDDDGRLRELDQAGWQVRYTEYVDSEGGALPARIAIGRDDTHARFLISRWQLGA